jgi:hypothetical protein
VRRFLYAASGSGLNDRSSAQPPDQVVVLQAEGDDPGAIDFFHAPRIGDGKQEFRPGAAPLPVSNAMFVGPT